MDTINTQNNNPTVDNNEDVQEIEARLEEIATDLAKERKEFNEKTLSIVEAIENEPETPDDDTEDEQEMTKMEDELGAELDEAMIDLATKEDGESGA